VQLHDLASLHEPQKAGTAEMVQRSGWVAAEQVHTVPIRFDGTLGAVHFIPREAIAIVYELPPPLTGHS
jgi:hypothetical protein